MKEGARVFLARLEDLKGRKAWTPARAALRRSLAFEPGTYPPAIGMVEPLLPGEAEGWIREAYYLVAALYALKDGEHREGRTLAQALREKAGDSASVEHRFLALLDADRDQIAFRLRQSVVLVEGGLDFARLLADLLAWFSPDRWVQARWAREFYGVKEEEKEEVKA